MTGDIFLDIMIACFLFAAFVFGLCWYCSRDIDKAEAAIKAAREQDEYSNK